MMGAPGSARRAPEGSDVTDRLYGVGAVDGPSGTGESTVSPRPAPARDAAYLDTGRCTGPRRRPSCGPAPRPRPRGGNRSDDPLAPLQQWDVHVQRLHVLSLGRRMRAVNLGTTGSTTSSATQNSWAMPGATR
jgi:hypothetical protein